MSEIIFPSKRLYKATRETWMPPQDLALPIGNRNPWEHGDVFEYDMGYMNARCPMCNEFHRVGIMKSSMKREADAAGMSVDNFLKECLATVACQKCSDKVEKITL